MKNTFFILLILLITSSCVEKKDEPKPPVPSEEKMTNQLRHVVLFKFKASATAEDIEKVETAFLGLPSKIKEIAAFEWGLNNSPENLNKGFTHCFFVSFANEEDRAVYLPHPDHLAFVEVLQPHLEDVLVLDYWTK